MADTCTLTASQKQATQSYVQPIREALDIDDVARGALDISVGAPSEGTLTVMLSTALRNRFVDYFIAREVGLTATGATLLHFDQGLAPYLLTGAQLELARPRLWRRCG